MPPSVRASLSPACKITGVKFLMDWHLPKATRSRQNIVHVALMRNMSSHNMALT